MEGENENDVCFCLEFLPASWVSPSRLVVRRLTPGLDDVMADCFSPCCEGPE